MKSPIKKKKGTWKNKIEDDPKKNKIYIYKGK